MDNKLVSNGIRLPSYDRSLDEKHWKPMVEKSKDISGYKIEVLRLTKPSGTLSAMLFAGLYYATIKTCSFPVFGVIAEMVNLYLTIHTMKLGLENTFADIADNVLTCENTFLRYNAGRTPPRRPAMQKGRHILDRDSEGSYEVRQRYPARISNSSNHPIHSHRS